MLKLLSATSRSATLLMEDGGKYDTVKPYELVMDGQPKGTVTRCVFSVYGLEPQSEHSLSLMDSGRALASLHFTTKPETVTLNVRDFGAKGDGCQDDTPFLQAAILCCPENGRVLIDQGEYLFTHLFLKSHISIELKKGATLRGRALRERTPILPGVTQSYDEKSEYHLASWEGNPLNAYASLITGVDVRDVVIYGEGTLDGGASKQNWWHEPKTMVGAWRPCMVFLNRCNSITMQGLTLRNSPSWNLHPYFSKDLRFLQLRVISPSDSPNTDGFDPESCENVELLGTWFSVGDDCVAIKSGKLYMGKRYHTPCRHIRIAHCRMGDGHGGVTLGSEMAGGISDVLVENCVFEDTDRGLRIKTRRGRGENGVIDQVLFRRIEMRGVKTPFVANSFYYCDPDGKTDYVQSRSKLPRDERTPWIRTLRFFDIVCTDCHAAAGYFLGLPERPIEHVALENVSVSFAKDPKPFTPAMCVGTEPCRAMGFYAENVEKLTLTRVSLQGQAGERVTAVNVAKVSDT